MPFLPYAIITFLPLSLEPDRIGFFHTGPDRILKSGLPDRIPDFSHKFEKNRKKFEVHILINMAKIANFQPKIGQDATFAPTFNEHNSAIL